MDGSCLKIGNESTTEPPPPSGDNSDSAAKEDSPWGKASFLFVVLVLLTSVIVFLLFKRNIIQFKNPKSESRENILTDNQIGTTGTNNNQSQTLAANHLEPHPTPTPFDDVVGEDGYAKCSDDGLDHDPQPSDPVDLTTLISQTPAAASILVDPGYSGLDNDAPGYNRLVHHGNSDVTISMATAAELDYKHLDLSALLASPPACESDRDE